MNDRIDLLTPHEQSTLKSILAQLEDKRADTATVALDFAESTGQLTYPAMPGEVVMIYTPTYIWAGTVGRVGPLAVELTPAVIVYETGTSEQIAAQNWSNAEPSGPVRIPWSSVISAVALP